MELKFWVWSYLCGGTVSLKFRQFNSAVCDAFGVFFVFRVLRGCGLFCECTAVGVVGFDIFSA